jgi:hypothetical protein
MATRIGINGFGRMGRLVLRAAWNWPELEFVHVNETGGRAVAASGWEGGRDVADEGGGWGGLTRADGRLSAS